jgi:hypothetical protein
MNILRNRLVWIEAPSGADSQQQQEAKVFQEKRLSAPGNTGTCCIRTILVRGGLASRSDVFLPNNNLAAQP